MKVLFYCLSGLIFLAAVIFAVLAAVAVKTFGKAPTYDAKKALRDRPDLVAKIEAGEKFLEGRSRETVEIRSRDGLALRGFYFPCDTASDRFIICFHGYHSDALNDFSTAFSFFNESGFNVLTVCQRSHGLSEGRFLTFGAKERYDVADWCDYVISRFGSDVKIVIDGVSMGSATVTMAADRSVGLPENVRAVVADCGYTTPWDEICHVAKTDYHLPAFPVVNLLRLVTIAVCGFDIRGCSSVEAVKNTDLPIFIAHGKEDNFVPYRMGEEIDGACVSDHMFYSVEGAGHGLAFLVDTEGYKNAVTGFLERYIG